MASSQQIKQRIGAVKNIGQITKAMELVAATKMRRAQETALMSRPYAAAASGFFLSLISNSTYKKFSPWLKGRKLIKKTLVILVASDKGLAGAFNANIFKTFEDDFNDFMNPVVVAVGKKAKEYLSRRGIEPVKFFSGFGDKAEIDDVDELTDYLTQGWLKREWDAVKIISPHFKTTLKSDVLTRQVLPVKKSEIIKTIKEIVPEEGKFSDYKQDGVIKKILETEYLIEPSGKEVLDLLAQHLIRVQVYHTILEANASEHSARMVAMKNASDNAAELTDDLTLEFNKTRQASITQEIAEITAGAGAIRE